MTKTSERLDNVNILAKIPRNLLNTFDQYCDQECYTRLEGIRHAIRKKMNDEEKKRMMKNE